MPADREREVERLARDLRPVADVALDPWIHCHCRVLVESVRPCGYCAALSRIARWAHERGVRVPSDAIERELGE